MAERKQKQVLVLAGVGVSVLGLLAVLGWMINSGGPAKSASSQRSAAIDTTLISTRTSGATPENDWVQQARQRLTLIEDMQTEQSQRIDALPNEYQVQLNAATAKLEEISGGYETVIAEQALSIEQLELQIQNMATGAGGATVQPTEIGGVVPQQGTNSRAPNATSTSQTPVQIAQPANGSSDFVSPAGGRVQVASAATASTAQRDRSFSQRFTLKAPSDERTTNIKTYQLGAYLPAGSYASAVVISGVDASVGVSSQAEPKPVLFRITGPATTAGYSSLRGARIDLTGCVVSGAATGDISSERVHVRLTQMTCQNRDQTIFETKLAGHMVSSGKAGLRGDVVSREGPSIRAAAMAGVLEGIAGASANTNNRVLDSLTNDNSTNQGSITQNSGQAALMQGAQNAASSLAQYYIERAEQYQPVISVYAGSKVELVFMEGVHLQ